MYWFRRPKAAKLAEALPVAEAAASDDVPTVEEYGEQLLESEHYQPPRLGFVFYTVDKLHGYLLFCVCAARSGGGGIGRRADGRG